MTSFSPLERVSILGISVDKGSRKEMLSRLEEFVLRGKDHHIVTANALMVLAAGKNQFLRNVIQSADLVVADSVGMVWAAQRKGQHLARLAGIDLLDALCGRAAGNKWGVYFLGAAPGVAEAAAKKLTQRWPGLRVVGCHHGYFQEDASVVAAIRRAAPQVLFVALESPRQELWIHTHRAQLGVPIQMGVGGNLDVWSGRLRRAPVWMRSVGLEWLFRWIQEPRRWNRMVQLPIFVYKVLREKS